MVHSCERIWSLKRFLEVDEKLIVVEPMEEESTANGQVSQNSE